VATTFQKIACLSQWIDDSYDQSIIGTELHVRRRVDKLMEEVGEVGEALGGIYGENPRKGRTHDPLDLANELLDVAITALGAYESISGNTGQTDFDLSMRMDYLFERVGLTEGKEN